MAEKFDGFTCFWKIRIDEHFCPIVGTILESSIFKIDILNDTEWCMDITLMGDSKTIELGIFKCCMGNSNIAYSVHLLTKSEWKEVKQKCWYKFKGDGRGQSFDLFEWKNYQHVKENYLSGDSLIIRLRMFNGRMRDRCSQFIMTSEVNNLWKRNIRNDTLDIDFETFSIISPLIKSSVATATVNTTATATTQTNIKDEYQPIINPEDILKLFKEKKFCYVTLRTEKKDFAVHKALLCARSPVFNAMFEAHMKENQSNIVNINDIDDDVLSLFLQFLHFEPLKDLNWDTAIKLYYAADKYQFEQLKIECVPVLKKEMSVENICEAFLLANMHQDENLKKTALEFFCNHSKLILLSDGWKDLMFKNTEMATEILCELAKKL